MKLLPIVILLLTFGCNRTSETNSVRDFRLVYQDDIDRVDFDINKVTRKYIDSVRTLDIDIEEDSRKEILDFILASELLTIDDSDLRNGCDILMMPESSFELEIALDKGKMRRFDWTSNNCGHGIDVLNQLTSLIKERTTDKISADQLLPTNITVE